MATEEQRAVQQRRAAAASTRRLSNRDLRELVRITDSLSVTEASAFERRGVVVHLVHPNQYPAHGRQAGQQDGPAPAGGAAHGEQAPSKSSRTPRQQARFERGAQRGARRRERRKSQALESEMASQNPLESGEPSAGASTVLDRSIPDAIPAQGTRTVVESADEASAGIAADMAAVIQHHGSSISNSDQTASLGQLKPNWIVGYVSDELNGRRAIRARDATAEQLAAYASYMEQVDRAKHARSPGPSATQSPAAKRTLLLQQDQQDEARSP